MIVASAMIEGVDRDAFDDLFNKYKNRVYAAAYQVLGDKQLAEDAAMETFIYLAENYARLKGSDGKAVDRYIYLVSRSKALDIVRREKKAPPAEELMEETAADEQSFSGFERIVLRDCISRLDRSDRELFYLYYSFGLGHKEIAQLQGISADTVRKRLQLARQRLRRLLEEG